MAISRSFLAAATAMVAMGTTFPAKAEERMFLSLGSRTPAARIFEASGLGTADARATGKVQEAEAQGVCEGFIVDAPKRVRECVRGLMAEHAAPVRASANCMVGVLRGTDGEALRYAGEWSADDAIGTERSKWRGANGQVLSNDMASGAATAAAQWAALCGPNAKPGYPTFADEMRARIARRSNGSPRDAFRQFVSFDHSRGSEELFAAKPNPTMARILSAELARNWIAVMGHNEQVLYGGPFTGKQMDGFSLYKITKVYESDDSTSAQIEAVLETPQKHGTRRQKQLYMFVNEENRWKLNELNYNPDGLPRFLHGKIKDFLRRVDKPLPRKSAWAE